MLVLSRKRGESIVIGNGLVEITIVEANAHRVRLGIIAPRELPVHRKEVQEVLDKKKQEQPIEEASSQVR